MLGLCGGLSEGAQALRGESSYDVRVEPSHETSRSRHSRVDVATQDLNLSTWVIVLLLDDGSVEKMRFELKSQE